MRTILGTLVLLAQSALCGEGNVQTIYSIPSISVPCREIKELSFKVGKLNGRKVAIDFTARIDSDVKALGTWLLAFSVNGVPVKPYYDHDLSIYKTRMINRPLFMVSSVGRRIECFSYRLFWYVFKSDSFEPFNNHFAELDPFKSEMFHYVLDITDLVAEEGRNTLRFYHWGRPKSPRPLIIEPLTVRTFEETERYRDPHGAQTFTPLPPVEKGVLRDYSEIPYKLVVKDSGSIQVDVGGNVYVIESLFSYPGFWANGFADDLRRHSATPEKDWSVAVERDGKLTTVVGKGRWYTVTRKITAAPNGARVEDTFECTATADVGLKLDNVMTSLEKPDRRHLGGVPIYTDMGVVNQENVNCSVLFLTGGSGVGVIAKNGIYRALSTIYLRDQHTGGIYNNHLVLAPGSKHTFKWDIVPVFQGTYFDFVNTVRNRWNVIFPVPAMFVPFRQQTIELTYFEDRKPRVIPGVEELSLEDIRKRLRNIGGDGTTYVMSTIPQRNEADMRQRVRRYGRTGKYAHGSAMFSATEFQEQMKRFTKKLHEADPNTRVLMYLCMYITQEDGAVQKYPDSIMKESDGSPVRYANILGNVNIHLAEGVSYLKQIEKYFDVAFNELGFDGIYFDVSCHAKPAADMSRWDGISGNLTEDYRVACEFSHSAIASNAVKAKIYKRLLDSGRCLYANQQPVTDTLYGKLMFPHFVETGTYDYNYRAHTFCPVAYNHYKDQSCLWDLSRHIRIDLLYGCLTTGATIYNRLPDRPICTSRMYPMTPQELHEGYILSEDKIITVRSGNFGWKASTCDDIYVTVFDIGEYIVERKPTISVSDGYRMARLELQDGDIAILERE